MKNSYLIVTLLTLTAMAIDPSQGLSAGPTISAVPVVRNAHRSNGDPCPQVFSDRGGLNDECATAIPLSVSAECAGSLATYDAAMASQTQAPVLCNGFMSLQANDLWFSFLATSEFTSVQVEGTLTFDPVIEGFSGTCGDLVSMGCADVTAPPSSGGNSMEILTMATVIGQTYYVRVFSYWDPAPLDFTFALCVFQASGTPVNDLCSSVVPVSLDPGSTLIFTGENTGALDTEGLGYPSVWHAFTTLETVNITLDYCGTAPAFLNRFTNLFIGCPDADVWPASSYEVTTCPDGNVTINYAYVCPGTYYYAVMLDEENAASGPYTINVTATAVPTGYCEAGSEQCDEYIATVTIGSIDNSSECVDGPAVDFTAQSTNILQGETVTITVLNGPSTYVEDAVSVWVDWNRNEGFCEADENFTLTSSDEGATFTGNVTAPPDAAVGITRMRIRMTYDEVPQACGTAIYGEVEDYSVNVLLSTGVNEHNTSAWAVFPNPSNGDMTIRYGAADAKVVIELFDVTGRAVHQEQRQLFNGQQVSLGLAGTLANGAYTLRLSSPEGRSEQRVVVQ